MLEALWKDAPEGAEACVGAVTDTESMPVAEAIEEAVRLEGSEDKFFTPAVLKHTTKREKTDFLAARCLWVDYDGDNLKLNAADVSAKCVLSPSFMVQTSRGRFHLYWLLDEWCSDIEQVERANQILVKDVGGDNCWDGTRILRLPDTVNTKHNTRTGVVHEDDSYLYPLTDVLALAEVGKGVRHKIRTGDRRGYPSRSERDLAIVGALKRAGVSFETIVRIFQVKPCGDRYREEGARGFDYLGLTLAKVEADEKKRREALPERNDDGRPCIYLTGLQLRERRSKATSALMAVNKPPVLFLVGAAVAYIAVDEKGYPTILPCSIEALQIRLSSAANFYTVKTTTKEILRKGTVPPRELCRSLLVPGSTPHFPGLRRVTDVPFIRKDGTVWQTEGYDAMTQYYYAPAPGLVVPEVSEHPTPLQVYRALKGVWKWFRQFPWVSRASRTNAWAMVLTPFILPLLDGHTPPFFLTKPKRRTGVSLFSQTLAYLVQGVDVVNAAPPKDKGDDEWRKTLMSALMSGRTIQIYDNLEGKIKSAHICSVTTASGFADRKLGETLQLVADADDVVFYFNGHNLILLEDLAPRGVMARIDADMARPWTRKFDLNLKKWRDLHRGQWMADVLTLLRAYGEAGFPTAPGDTPVIGGFDSWVQVMGGLLTFLGLKDFLGNVEEQYEEAEVSGGEVEMAARLKACYEDLGEEWFYAGQVVEKLQDAGSAIRGAWKTKMGGWSKTQVGDLFRTHKDEWFVTTSEDAVEEYRVVRELKRKTKGYRWRMEHRD